MEQTFYLFSLFIFSFCLFFKKDIKTVLTSEIKEMESWKCTDWTVLFDNQKSRDINNNNNNKRCLWSIHKTKYVS